MQTLSTTTNMQHIQIINLNSEQKPTKFGNLHNQLLLNLANGFNRFGSFRVGVLHSWPKNSSMPTASSRLACVTPPPTPLPDRDQLLYTSKLAGVFPKFTQSQQLRTHLHWRKSGPSCHHYRSCHTTPATLTSLPSFSSTTLSLGLSLNGEKKTGEKGCFKTTLPCEETRLDGLHHNPSEIMTCTV